MFVIIDLLFNDIIIVLQLASLIIYLKNLSKKTEKGPPFHVWATASSTSSEATMLCWIHFHEMDVFMVQIGAYQQYSTGSGDPCF